MIARRVLDAIRPLDLRHDARHDVDMAVRLGGVHDLAQFVHVLGGTGKAERDPVHAQADGKAGVGAILVGQRRDRQQRVGHVDALARLDLAAVDDAAVDVPVNNLIDAQLDVAVVDQHGGAGFEVRRQVEVNRNDGDVGGKLAGVLAHIDVHPDEDDRLIDRHRHGLRQPADAHLGALQIGEERHRFTGDLACLAHQASHARMEGVVAVAEVHARHAHAGTDHLGQNLNVGAGWTNGCDNVGHS
jgi:hypothetical protein